MSRIEQLIEQLCPDGVEFKELGEIAKISTGKLNANAMTLDGLYPFFTCSEKPYLIDTFAFDTEAILISGNGSQLGHINYYNGKFNAYQRTYVICEFSTNITASYLLHFLKGFLKEYIWKNVKEGSVPYITLPMLQNFQIPIPPLPIQQEIVRILDTFTALDGSMQAELEARRKQYEHYRNQLLNFEGKEVEWKTLGECLQRTKGTPITAQQMSEINKVGAPIKIFAGGKTVAFVDYGDIPEKDILTKKSIVVKSRGIIEFEYIDKPFSHKNEFWSYHSNSSNINIKYVFYYLKSKEQYFQSVGQRMSKMPQLSIPDTDKYSIPIPSLSEQERIVGILDKFDALVASTSSATGGIPAEIEARRKQYEYYREKLLSFEIKGNK